MPNGLAKKMRIVPALGMALGILVSASGVTLAQAMSSTNYPIPADTVSVGGNRSTSGGYIADDTIGDWATGEDLSSLNYAACSGYQCFQGTPYVSFSVTSGTAYPGLAGQTAALGLLSTGAVKTSDSASVDSIFITLTSSAEGGSVVSVRDVAGALARVSSPTSRIDSATATLAPSSAGYGICIESVTQDVSSPTSFSKTSPYDGACNKTMGHAVGAVSAAPASILQSSGALVSGQAEILITASISATSPAGNDYSDTLTFVASS